MSPSVAKDQEQLNRFLLRLQSATSAWLLFKTDLPFLKQHADAVIRVCVATLPARDVVALRSTIVLIALGERPNLSVLEDAFMSEGNRIVAAAQLADLVPSRPFPDLLALAERAAQRSTNAYAVTLAVRLAMQMRGHTSEDDIAALERVHEMEPASGIDNTLWTLLNRARGPVKQRGLALFDKLLDRQIHSDGIASFFAAHADESRIPRLWDLLARFLPPDPTGSRNHLLSALVRLKAPGVREALFEELAGANYLSVLKHLSELLRGTNDREAIARLLDRFDALPAGSHAGKDFAQTVAAIGGPETMPAVERLIKGLPEHMQAMARLEARGLTLDAVMDELRAIGFLTDAQRTRATTKRRQSTMHARILDALEAAGAAYRFDTEFSGTPVPHDRLVLNFADLSGPAFEPEDVGQQGPDPAAETNTYAVSFRIDSRKYSFRCGSQAGWYDHRAVARHINQALNDLSGRSRFIEIDVDGQYATYVFTDPAAAAEAARRGLIAPPSTTA